MVELVVAMGVLVVLAGIGIPGLQGTLERQRAATAMHRISAQFALARNTAITQRVPVSVCPSIDGARCRSDSDWSAGWIMYRDPVKAGQPAGAGAVMRYENAPVAGSLRLLSSSGRKAIRFLSDGRSAGSNLRLRLCNDRQLLGEVVVNNLGRVRSSRPVNRPPCQD
ncbi:MAG TPA: pilus assembly protein [Xanthomonadaceae bacterium]|nr:pilus assembly protein [Xanthomonadaceae bacterium]